MIRSIIEAQFARAEGLGYRGFKVSGQDGEALQALNVEHEQALNVEHEQALQRLREGDAALDQIL